MILISILFLGLAKWTYSCFPIPEREDKRHYSCIKELGAGSTGVGYLVEDKSNSLEKYLMKFIEKSKFPKEEVYSLTSQIRRSSRSVGAQIAEAWGKRRYRKHFISKLTDSDAEHLETEHWIETAVDCGYLSADTAKSLLADNARVGQMLNAMMRKASLFCKEESP